MFTVLLRYFLRRLNHYRINRRFYVTERFGENFKILYPENFQIGKRSTFNDWCWFNARYGIEIGDDVAIGPKVLIHSVDHVIKNIKINQNANFTNRVEGKKVIIGNDVWIGANVTILKGSVIPNKVVIGAGTIITEKNSKRLRVGDIVVNDLKLRILGNRKDIKN
jgi:maltose O-acetyltransferase